MKIRRLLLFIVILASSCSTPSSDREAILNVMKSQEIAWNNGDISGFMEGYWKSDSLKFIGKKGIKYGWENTLINYQNSYPNQETMGQLTFGILELDVNKNCAFMLGTWKLIREKDQLNGHFTLYWKKIQNKWLITIDHSS